MWSEWHSASPSTDAGTIFASSGEPAQLPHTPHCPQAPLSPADEKARLFVPLHLGVGGGGGGGGGVGRHSFYTFLHTLTQADSAA